MIKEFACMTKHGKEMLMLIKTSKRYTGIVCEHYLNSSYSILMSECIKNTLKFRF